MQLILKFKNVSLHGAFNSKSGYYIAQRGDKFFSYRKPVNCYPEAHWLFIKTCIDIIEKNALIKDIRISGKELNEAISEAGYSVPGIAPDVIYNYNELKTFIQLYCL